MSAIDLSCLVSGDGADKIFPVDIPSNKTVGALKELIKAEWPVRFKHIDAVDIQLFKVPLPEEDVEQAGDPPLNKDAKELSSRRAKIAATFPNLEEGYIVVNPAAIIELRCLVSGDTTKEVFTVKIPRNDDIFHVSLPRNGADRASNPGINEDAKELDDPFAKIADIFQKPQGGEIQVIAANPVAQWKRPRSPGSEARIWPPKRQNVQIPAVEHLVAFLNKPLSDAEKLPVSRSIFRALISTTPGRNRCTEEEVSSVFRLTYDDNDGILTSEDGILVHFIPTVTNPPPDSGTEAAFISAWDRNIRDIIERCVSSGQTIRAGNRHTSIRQLRPAYGFLINKTCPFRGEEKGPDSMENPREELSRKVTWIYNSTPYILGYYASGPTISLVALTPPARLGGNPDIYNLVQTDLRWRRERIQNILHIINLSTLLVPLSRLMEGSGAEFMRIQRRTCMIESTSSFIFKTYQDLAIVRHLRSVYAMLKDHDVPNVDYLSYNRDQVVRLEPRGIQMKPHTKQELHDCVRCVLEALVALHKIPLYHRDIRPDNVIRRVDNPSLWFLIDWEDASGPETAARPDFATETHSPDVFHDGHGAEVDIWGVGLLIENCAAPVSLPVAAALSLASLGLGYVLGSKTAYTESPKVAPELAPQPTPAAQDDEDSSDDEDETLADGDLSLIKPGLLEPCKMVLVVRTDLGMTSGKIAAQCGHATLACYKALLKTNPALLKHWERTGQAKIALKGSSEDQLLELEAIAKSLNLCARSIIDAGRTQIAAGSRTVLAIGPAPVPLINQVTGHLRLL
ncbi:hypothetical protein FA15DRAFT_705765 [Coprinopsis marcescibilis]|uniref:peptidyl-tRNA hydrolase n=1 Tax=Coprinopsis marcescibilis TaxID=230819 RepID=A0A5C3L4H4_COPMA|nr:hypothetical protein FA15DRAFT_705765 [Coprinopsis marcescibilis]